MKDNIKDLAAIVACILTAYFVANAATVEGALLYGMPAILFCAGVGFVVHWIVAIPSLITSSEKYFDFTGMIATLLVVAVAMFAILSSGQQASIRSTIVAIFVSIWTLRLGTFLYIRIVKSGEDKRFREIKKSLLKFLMTWTLSALWVFLTTVNAVTIIVLRLSQRSKKRALVRSQKTRINLLHLAYGLYHATQIILERRFFGWALRLSPYHFCQSGNL